MRPWFLLLLASPAAALLRPVPTARRALPRIVVHSSSGAEAGVSLAGLVNLDDDALYLSRAVQSWLDEEWIEQDVHAEIGHAVAAGYREARESLGYDDLLSVMMHIGSSLEGVDMGDAFVGPWDVANTASDFIMARLGRETAACCTTAPTGQFSEQSVADVQVSLEGVFQRYKFLANLLEAEDPDTSVSWAEASVVVALLLGFRLREGGVVDASAVNEAWLASVGSSLPAIDAGAPLLQTLRSGLPEDGSDERDTLVQIAKSTYGEEAYRLAEREASPEFRARTVVAQWLIHNKFLDGEVSLG